MDTTAAPRIRHNHCTLQARRITHLLIRTQVLSGKSGTPCVSPRSFTLGTAADGAGGNAVERHAYPTQLHTLPNTLAPWLGKSRAYPECHCSSPRSSGSTRGSILPTRDAAPFLFAIGIALFPSSPIPHSPFSNPQLTIFNPQSTIRNSPDLFLLPMPDFSPIRLRVNTDPVRSEK